MSNIIQEIRSGNKNAVRAVYQKYAKDVYNFAKSITGNHEDALDATKKSFSILFANIKNGDEPANLRTAALKIAYDEAYKVAASKKAEDVPLAGTDLQYEESALTAEENYSRPRTIEEDNSGFDEPAAPVAVSAAVGSVFAEDDYEENYPQKDIQNDEQYDDIEYAEDEPYADEDEYIKKPRRIRNQVSEIQFDEDDEYEEKPQRRSKRKKAHYDEEAEYDESPRPAKKDIAVYNAFDDEETDEEDEADYEDEPRKKPRNKGLFIFCVIVNIILILILLWFLCGLLVNLGVLPNIDLGYTWFNDTIYPLF